MTLRLKNISKVAKIFGVKGIGNFADNKAIRSNPQIIQLLLAKQEKKARKNKKQSNLERNYYQKLLEKSNQVKADRIHDLERIKAIKSRYKSKEEAINNTETVEAPIEDLIELKESYDNYYLESKDKYYHITITKNLFGSYSLIRSWGGLGSKLGNYKISFYDRLELAQDAVKLIIKQRVSKGYKVL